MIIISKASPIGPDQGIPDTCIEIIGTLPDMADLEKAGWYYDQQAQEIEEALYRSLPGGTYDRLVGRLLARKATHFRVPHFNNDGEKTATELSRNLIIAAPELLAACEAAMAFLEDIWQEGVTNPSLGDQLKAAIAKARGQDVING